MTPPARPRAIEMAALPLSSHSVNIRPMPTGMVDWKTMAPVMLPRARESLPSRTQKKLLTFSGSSVASGSRMRERMLASAPQRERDVGDISEEEDDPGDQAQLLRRPEAEAQSEAEEDHEEGEIAVERGDVGLQGDVLGASFPVDVGRPPDEAHGEGRQQ